MKIGIVILHCLQTHASRYVGEVTKHFIKQGHEVHVFTNRWDALDPAVIVHKIPVFPYNDYLRELSFTILASIITKFYKLDVTMAQATRYFSPDVCYMQFVYKEWISFMKRNGFAPVFPNIFALWVEGWNTRRAKRVIAMSNIVKKELMKNHRVPEANINIIYSGVDLNKFNPAKRAVVSNDIRHKLGLNSDDIVIISVGNPYTRKGLEYAVKALPLIFDKRVKLLVLGRDIGNDKFENYKKLAENVGVSERLIYGGFRGDVENFYAASDIFLLPTLYEPFGLVVLEALSAGLPVVVSKTAGAAELVEDGKEGILLKDPKDEKEIATAINMLLENERYKKFGKNARLKAEKYPWSRLANELLNVFEEVKTGKK